MKKIAIRINSDEKYPDFSFDLVDDADAYSWKHYGDYEGMDIIFVGRFFYWVLLLAEKISEWYGGKLGELSNKAYQEYCGHPNSPASTIPDYETVWKNQFGEEEDRVFIQEFRAKERMRQRVL